MHPLREAIKTSLWLAATCPTGMAFGAALGAGAGLVAGEMAAQANLTDGFNRFHHADASGGNADGVPCGCGSGASADDDDIVPLAEAFYRMGTCCEDRPPGLQAHPSA